MRNSLIHFPRQHPPMFGVVDSEPSLARLFIRSKEQLPNHNRCPCEECQRDRDSYANEYLHGEDHHARVFHLPQPFDEREFAAKCWLAGLVVCLAFWGAVIWFLLSLFIA